MKPTFNFPSLGPAYIIAEIGGNFTNAREATALIDAAADCNVNAIKLQTYRAETIASRKAIFDMENTGVTSQFDLFKKYEIDKKLHHDVFNYAARRGLDYFSTPSHESDADMLEGLGVAVYKIGSDDAVNLPFLRYVARKGKPMILATGMCTMDEVRDSARVVREAGCPRLILLHAITSYPTHAEHVNLAAMQAMMREFPDLEVGYSDHTLGITACICAAAMGARVLEKHFTCDKHAPGPDHMLSADPAQMKELVQRVREFELMRGNGIKQPALSEEKTRLNNRKSIVLMHAISKGERLTPSHLAVKRPGHGIAPRHLPELPGRSVNKDMKRDDILSWEDLD
ncbi:MAG TPA: N-acylneuraminate-9-phosphate synthase [Elusimicrobia bacterium]|nr:N-acylneuraminate-9-phosphate synthase [Elusimicrobiota bacterium]HBT62221.1 N-acylneuraminate-9-phosphate synthase [Elusimicrobiota bacterium]